MGAPHVRKSMTAVRGAADVPAAELAAVIREGLSAAPAPVGRVGLAVSEVVRRLRGDLAFDVFVEAWWNDGAEVAIAIPTTATAVQWITTEHVLKRPDYSPRPERLKVIGTAYRRDDYTPEAFFEYWRNVHAPVSARVPGLGAYVVSEVVRPASPTDDVDAFVEQWWPDEATLDATGDTQELAVAWADVSNYAKTTGTFWLVRETVLDAPAYDLPGLLEG